ncbi:MAG: ferrous iron transport protein A [Pseudomonadales bacterium]|nr:ferrous iron transport protein A [Pseudomonadales bacterium]
MLKLRDLKKNVPVKITGYDPQDSNYALRLQTLGLIPGTPLELVRFAPLGDPVEIHYRGTRLTLRPSEADCLLLEEI